MRTILIVPGVLALLLFAGCKKDEGDEDMYTVDALTFGTYYTNCDSACVKMYEVTPSSLCRDDSADLKEMLAWGYKFSNINLLDGSRLAAAKPLLTQVPKALFDKSAVVFGDPGPEGGLYIKVRTIPGSYRFKIDLRNSADQPAEVQAFKQQVLEVMAKLK